MRQKVPLSRRPARSCSHVFTRRRTTDSLIEEVVSHRRNLFFHNPVTIRKELSHGPLGWIVSYAGPP